MGDESKLNELLAAVPLFPLPTTVLFPRAMLPLHIFEERYKEMTADVLAGSRQMAMAFLEPGWEKTYYQKKTPIDPVVCVGEILTHKLLENGECYFLLQGHTRARVVREFGDRPYRLAQLERLEEVPALEIDLEGQRERLSRLLADRVFTAMSGVRQFRQMLTSPLPTADVADLIAFHVLDDVLLKQSLLAEPDVRQRVRRTVQAVSDLRPVLQALHEAQEQQSSMNLLANVRFPADPSVN